MARKRSGKPRGFATQVIHAGQRPDPETGAVMQPLYLTSTYRQPGLGEGWDYTYARTINPTRLALERNVAALEGGAGASAFASGMSAIAAVLDLLDAGDHVVASRGAYGGTYRLFEGPLRRQGLTFDWIDTSRLEAIEAAVRSESRMLYVETPTNPTLALTDIAAVATIARRHSLRLVVDNTFMSPCLQRPIDLGADFVVHSTTKYLNGHSDSVGGCVISGRAEDAQRIAELQKTVGAILSPLDSFLVLRGIKTLALRMERHEHNAARIAPWLVARPEVRHVFYPGLESHPQHELARRQMRGFGGVISFELGSYAAAKAFVDRLELCALAESLGGVETLVSHPATMTHGSYAVEERERLGVTDGLLRISVGIEACDDILADLEQAMAAVPA
jgi:cystathionine beta-lyase/cystathionine gamma-synthase